MSVTKSSIRQNVWSYLEDNDIALFPRPVFNRIPNFKSADIACERAVKLEEFKRAKVIKVNPDKPQEIARLRTLEASKTLLVPTPRLRFGLFNQIIPPDYRKESLKTCASSHGVKYFSKPIGLDSKLKIDLIIVGSVAVSKKGHRIGKGKGYADLEYAMMCAMGAVDPLTTTVVTTVHDCQVYDEIPDHLFGAHDLNVDIIVTPTQLIRCEPRLAKPKGILWSILTEERLEEMPILNIFRDIQQKEGKCVQLCNC